MNTKQNLTELSSKEKMFRWMRENGQTYTNLSAQMGITSCGLGRLFKGQTIPTRRHRQLVALGVPAEVLPQPLDIPTGPKPKQHEATTA